MQYGATQLPLRFQISVQSINTGKNSERPRALRYYAWMHIQDTAQPTLYTLMGGDGGVRALVDRFYDLMELEPDFAALRAIHPVSTDGSRDKLYWFLSGWSGGPDHYVERFGHPRLRMRHMPYQINAQGRDQWLRCMARALQDMQIDEALQLRLMESFYQTADWMRNHPG